MKGVEEAGFKTLFPIQERAIGPLLAGKNLIGQAKTGSGKTVAFGLPLLERVNPSDNSTQALVLAPTRELAQQISSELARLGSHTGARILAVFGGQSINVQLEELRRGVQIVVGTPGRIIDHLKRRTLNLREVGFVVLDEADRMLDMGFIDDVNFILAATPAKKQLALFSATMPEPVVQLTERYMTNPEKVLLDTTEPSVTSLAQYYTVVERDQKLEALLSLLARGEVASAIVFCRTKQGAHHLARDLDKHYVNAIPIHGDLSQTQRNHSMGLFKSGRVDVLVATDVASRGLDVANVDCVINYDVPEEPLVYFHRVGRTARAGRAGKSYTLVSPDEFGDFARILKFTSARIRPLNTSDESYFLGSGKAKQRRHVGWDSHKRRRRLYRRGRKHVTRRSR